MAKEGRGILRQGWEGLKERKVPGGRNLIDDRGGRGNERKGERGAGSNRSM